MLQDLYDKMPYYVQNLMCTIKGWIIQHRRYGNGFYRELEAYEKKEYKFEEELTSFLDNVRNVSYYRKVFESNPDKEGLDLLNSFPILTKMDVKRNMAALSNKDCKEKQFLMRTSGTTGGGLVFPYTVRMENKHWAVWWRYRRCLGIRLNTWCGWFGGKRIINPNNKSFPFWRVNYSGHQVMYSSLHLSAETISEFYEDIKNRKLTWLHGYPSHLAKFSALALDRGLEPLDGVKWVTTGAENLIGNQVVLITKMFPNAIIRQHYGLMEGVANFSQDIEGNWQIDDDFAYVEFIPITENSDNSEVIRCRIVGTGFSNPAFPLIRYDTGDVAEIKWHENNGKKVPEIKRIEGRSSNIIKGPDGFEINEARLSIILHDFNNIIEAQFVQHSLTNIVLKIVKNSYFDDKDEHQLLSNISDCFDKRMNVQLVYVNEIERTKSGKLKLVISEIEGI